METTVKKTWKPTTAGILNIITGVLRAFTVIALIVAITVINTGRFPLDSIPPEVLPFTASILNIILILALIVSISEAVFPIVGGVFALQRRKWGWALAGSIIAIFGALPLGVASTVFVAMAKDEFE